MKTADKTKSILATLEHAQIQIQLEARLLRVGRLFCAQLNEHSQKQTIYAFLTAYILLSEELANSLLEINDLHGLDNIIVPHVKLAGSYIDATNEELSRHPEVEELKQFLSLLHGAYIFQRLVEELDDRISRFIGVPLTHYDLVNANLIAHDIIGDSFANRLDRVVLSLFQQAKITKSLVEAQLDKQQIKQHKTQNRALSGVDVQCFAANHNLEMSFNLEI